MNSKGWDFLVKKVDNFSDKKGLTSFINPYSMLLLKDKEQIASGINYWHVDGISLVNLLNKAFSLRLSRFSFDDTSIAPIVFNNVKNKQLKLAIIGTHQNYIVQAVQAIEEKYTVKVDYYRNGYFNSPQEREECLAYITNEKFDVVICGMGTPYQEQFLIDLKSYGWFGYGYTCGGYLHQIAKSESYYPPVFDKLNIRWVYRIIDEPKLFKRYAIDYFRFFVLFKKYAKKSR